MKFGKNKFDHSFLVNGPIYIFTYSSKFVDTQFKNTWSLSLPRSVLLFNNKIETKQIAARKLIWPFQFQNDIISKLFHILDL